MRFLIIFISFFFLPPWFRTHTHTHSKKSELIYTYNACIHVHVHAAVLFHFCSSYIFIITYYYFGLDLCVYGIYISHLFFEHRYVHVTVWCTYNNIYNVLYIRNFFPLWCHLHYLWEFEHYPAVLYIKSITFFGANKPFLFRIIRRNWNILK